MGKEPLALVSFDLDGTILHGRIMYHLRVQKELQEKIVALDELYDQGKLGYEEALRFQYELLKGLNPGRISPDPNKLPLIRDLGRVTRELKRSQVKVVILTDNPSFAAEPLRGHGFDDIIASETETSDDVLTGRAKLLTNKLSGLQEYCQTKGIDVGHCAHVGDWINDIIVFKGVGLSVAFNSSEEEVARSASFCVRSDSLLDVFRVLKPSLPKR